MTDLHTFREAVDNIAAGGGSFRFGKFPTYYFEGSFGMREQHSTFSKDSAGFSLEDQQSIDWVLIPPEEWRARQARLAEAVAQCNEINAKSHPFNDVVSVSITDTYPRSWWKFWR